MSNTLKYKATERYSYGWIDPRVFKESIYISFGDYRFADLASDSPHLMDIAHVPKDAIAETRRVNKSEFVAYIEAFLKEHRERNNS